MNMLPAGNSSGPDSAAAVCAASHLCPEAHLASFPQLVAVQLQIKALHRVGRGLGQMPWLTPSSAFGGHSPKAGGSAASESVLGPHLTCPCTSSWPSRGHRSPHPCLKPAWQVEARSCTSNSNMAPSCNVICPHEPHLAAGSHLQVSLPRQLPACKQPLFSQNACLPEQGHTTACLLRWRHALKGCSHTVPLHSLPVHPGQGLLLSLPPCVQVTFIPASIFCISASFESMAWNSGPGLRPCGRGGTLPRQLRVNSWHSHLVSCALFILPCRAPRINKVSSNPPGSPKLCSGCLGEHQGGHAHNYTEQCLRLPALVHGHLA